MKDMIKTFLEDLARETGERIPDRKDVTDTLKKAAGAIPFSREVVSIYYCASDTNTPGRVKGVIGAALAYLVLPADAVPDLLPAIGFTDDVSVLTTTLGIVAAHINDDHKKSAEELLSTPSDDENDESPADAA